MEAPHRGMLTEKTPQRIKCKAGWWELCTLSAVSTHETRAARAHTIPDWSRFELHNWRQDLVAFQAFLISIFCCFFATSAARFRQVNLDNPVAHHDALEFPDGQVVLVTRLCDGQRATVLQLPADTRAAIAERTVVERQLRESSLSI